MTEHPLTEEITVTRSGVPIATRDYGGEGRPVVLIHGATANLESLDGVGRHLLPDHRAVAMDLRNHGRSGTGPWEWAGILGDVRGVVEHYGLERVAVVGHSLGGGVATLYAERYPDCGALVNLDGYGMGWLVGTVPEHLKKLSDATRKRAPVGLPGLDEPVSEEAVTAMRSMATAAAQIMRVPEAVALAQMDRALVPLGDGRYELRPTRKAQQDVRDHYGDFDLLAIIRGLDCPVLLVEARAPVRGRAEPSELAEWMAGRRAELARAVDALVAERNQVVFESVEGPHQFPAQEPEATAGMIRAFLSRIPPSERTRPPRREQSAEFGWGSRS